MNLKNILDRVSIITRGRFSGSSNLWWILQLADLIKKVDKMCIGPGSVVSVQALPMASGFIPKPKSLIDIIGVMVDGEELFKYTKNNAGIILPSDAPALTFKSLNANITSTSMAASIGLSDSLQVITDTIGARQANVIGFSGAAKTGILSIVDGYAPTQNEMVGWVLELVPGEYYNIVENNAATNGICGFEVSQAGGPEINSPVTVTLLGLSDGALDGWSVAAGADQFEITTSTWSTPISTPGGWTDPTGYEVAKYAPSGEFHRDGVVFTSNVTLKGYKATTAPVSITEEFDFPEGNEDLFAAGLWWMAEMDMDPSSPHAAARYQHFQKLVKDYIAHGSRVAGTSGKKSFQFTSRRD